MSATLMLFRADLRPLVLRDDVLSSLRPSMKVAKKKRLS